MFEDTYRHKGLRKGMIEVLKHKGISNPAVLRAMSKIPRHFFMDSAFLEHAYQDKPFPIGEGQTISQPYTVAFQTELLHIEPNQKILEIGTGSGYQTSILYFFTPHIVSIEYNKNLYLKARKILQIIGCKEAKLILGDGSMGYAEAAPYDRILVTAGAPVVPDSLVEQLAVGGIMVIPVGNKRNQVMLKISKLPDGSLLKEEFGSFCFVPLKGKEGWNDMYV